MTRRGRWIDGLTLDTVIVHCKHNGPSLKGVLVAAHADALQLRDVVALDPDQNTVLDGLVGVPRENVEFMQVLGGAG